MPCLTDDELVWAWEDENGAMHEPATRCDGWDAAIGFRTRDGRRCWETGDEGAPGEWAPTAGFGEGAELLRTLLYG